MSVYHFPEGEISQIWAGTETLSCDLNYHEECYLHMPSRGIKGFQAAVVGSMSMGGLPLS